MWALRNLALAYLLAGKPDQAEPVIRQAAAALAGPGQPPVNASHATSYIGEELVERGKMATAEPVLRECLAIREQYTPDAWWTAYTEAYLLDALATQGKYAEAEPRLLRVYERLAKSDVQPGFEGRWQDRRRIMAEHLARLYQAAGKPELAMKWRAEAAKYPFVAPPPRAVKK